PRARAPAGLVIIVETHFGAIPRPPRDQRARPKPREAHGEDETEYPALLGFEDLEEREQKQRGRHPEYALTVPARGVAVVLGKRRRRQQEVTASRRANGPRRPR